MPARSPPVPGAAVSSASGWLAGAGTDVRRAVDDVVRRPGLHVAAHRADPMAVSALRGAPAGLPAALHHPWPEAVRLRPSAGGRVLRPVDQAAGGVDDRLVHVTQAVPAGRHDLRPR